MKSKFLKRMLQMMLAGIILMAIGVFMTPGSFRDRVQQWTRGEWPRLKPERTVNTEHFSYDFSEDKISKLEINLSSADIKIIPTDGKTLKGEWISENPSDLRHEWTGNVLRIERVKNQKRHFVFFNWPEERQLNLLVPKDVLLDLDIQTVSGDIFIDGKEAGNVKVQTTSGKVEGKWNRAESLKLSTTSGSITAEVATGSVETELTSISGDVELRADTVEKMNVETASGEIEVRANEVKTSSGRLYSLSGDIEVYGVSKETGVDVTTLSGTLSLWDMSVGKTFSQPGNGKLSVETASGDITVK